MSNGVTGNFGAALLDVTKRDLLSRSEFRTSFYRERRSKVVSTPLSPLQVYLYSDAALVDTVLVTADSITDSSSADWQDGSPSSTPRGVFILRSEVYESEVQLDHGAVALNNPVQRAASLLHDTDDEGGVCDVSEGQLSSASSSVDSAAAAGGSSRVASLTGRYVVLSRTVSLPLKAANQAFKDNTVPSSLNLRWDTANSSHHVLDASQEVQARLRRSSPLSFSLGESVRPSRVFPEEALRRLAQKTSVVSNVNLQRPTNVRAAPLNATHFRTVSISSLDAHTSQQKQQQVHQNSATASAASLSDELEVHVIDATHILVFFPPSVESAALLKAMAVDSKDGVSWRVWDPFRSADGGPRLKLSETLRQLMEEGSPPSINGAASPFSSSLLSQERRTSRMTYEVTLWTARGNAVAVHDALITSARLRPYRRKAEKNHTSSSMDIAADATCMFTIDPVVEKANAVGVRVDVPTPPKQANAVELQHNATQAPPAASPTQRTPAIRRANCLRDVLLTLASHPAVRWVEETYRRAETLNNVVTKVIQQGSCSTYSVKENAYTADNTEAGHNTPLWDLHFNGSGEIIAVSDSGVDTKSCYFRDPVEPIAYYPQVNPRHRKIISYQAYVAASGVVDTTDLPNGHGTHVAGMASGYVPPSVSVVPLTAALYNGVAAGAKLFVRDMNGGANADLLLPMNLPEIFHTAYEVGARISSNSWGLKTRATSYLAIERMFDAAVVERRDLLVLAAAGNSGKDNLYVPGRAKNVLTVGSHLNSPLTQLQNTVPANSAYGVTYDGRHKPDLVAPGGGGGTKTNVYSAMAAKEASCGTTKLHGTSMATAAAAGAAAVVRQYLRERWKYKNPSSALLRAALLHSTTSIPSEPLRSGFGRLDLSHLLSHENHTVDKRLRPLEHWFVDDVVVHDDEVRQYCFVLQGLTAFQSSGGASCSLEASLTVTATLVWNDPATAVEGSVRSQVHDIDVMLITRHGHTFFSGANGVAREQFNTAEQIRVPISFETHDGAKANTSVTEWMDGFRVLVRGAVVRNAAGQNVALAVSGPGVSHVSDCAVLFHQWRTPPTTAVVAPVEVPQQSSSSATFCPMNCSSHGTCDEQSLLCLCEPRYTSVDCAECNEVELCHGHGTCDTSTMTCTCDPSGHFADATCGTCADGWYGPNCASSCTCLHGGVCDKTSGLCTCVKDTTLHTGGKGCFQGPQCQYCCDGFGGSACNQRSYWCNTTGEVVVVDAPGGGFIQINDFKTYGYSCTCRWAIRGKPGQKIQLEFISYDVEQYDALYVYDIVPDPSTAAAPTSSGGAPPTSMRRKQVRKVTGKMTEPLPVITSTAEQLELDFVSDWDGPGEGFVLYYRFTSCSETCKRMDPVGHWRCGDAFGLPSKQCICEPPYVGWNCNEDASDISMLSRELGALQVSHKRVWQDGELAWLLPRSVLTVVEVRLPVQRIVSTADTATAWSHWRSATAAVQRWKIPVSGMARLPLIVHGFSEVQVPLLTLPTAPFYVSTAASSGGALSSTSAAQHQRQSVKAHLKLRVQLQANSTWLDNDAGALQLTLGVSAATEMVKASRESNNDRNGSLLPHNLKNRRSNIGEAANTVAFSDINTPLSLNAFDFTPMSLQNLFHCADVLVVEMTVPLNLLTNASAPTRSPAAKGEAMGTDENKRKEKEKEEEESHWTTRVVLTLLWKDVAGLKVPNVSMVDAVVFADEVVLKKEHMVKAINERPAAGSTVRGEALEVSCRAVARVPVHTGQQVVEATSLKVATPGKVSSTVRFLVLFFALCIGVVGGTMWVLWTQDHHRPAYVSVQNADDGQDMQVIGKRG